MNDVVWQRSVEYVGTQVEDLLVILDLQGGMYYSMNSPAADIWEMLAQPTAEEAMVDVLVAKYRVTQENCAQSVHRVLNDLSGKGLAKVVSS